MLPRHARQAVGKLRIIGGTLRGSRLAIPDIPGLRPTPDRVRETLFNWLMPVVAGARCVDLYAGTGALGIEALSRGAGEVTFVESDARLAGLLRENLARLKQDALVFQEDALGFVRRCGRQYDLVFVDPPFSGDAWRAIAQALEDNHCLSNKALIYVESPDGRQLDLPANWNVFRTARAGAVRCELYRRQ